MVCKFNEKNAEQNAIDSIRKVFEGIDKSDDKDIRYNIFITYITGYADGYENVINNTDLKDVPYGPSIVGIIQEIDNAFWEKEYPEIKLAVFGKTEINIKEVWEHIRKTLKDARAQKIICQQPKTVSNVCYMPFLRLYIIAII